MRARYQYGNLTIRKRKKGSDVWQFRWMQNGRQKSVLIGTIEKYPAEADAQRAVEHFRIQINAQNPQQQFHSVTVGALIDRFMKEYAPKYCRKPTQRVYESLFNTHIRPKWAGEFIQNVKTIAVEDWLESYPHSRQIKAHVRRLMHTLFVAAIRWELIARNPIDYIRQSRKRLKTPRRLTPAEFKLLIPQLSEPYKTIVITIACLGLRVCELMGLQWGDISFDDLTVKIQRDFVEGEIYPTKTEASEALLPLDPDLAVMLMIHKERSCYTADSDFIFAGATGKPRWPDVMLTDHIKPAAVKAGIGKIGWHTFRHTYSSLLRAHGTDIKVQQELLRHSDVQTTLNLYTQAVRQKSRKRLQG